MIQNIVGQTRRDLYFRNRTYGVHGGHDDSKLKANASRRHKVPDEKISKFYILHCKHRTEKYKHIMRMSEDLELVGLEYESYQIMTPHVLIYARRQWWDETDGHDKTPRHPPHNLLGTGRGKRHDSPHGPIYQPAHRYLTASDDHTNEIT